MSDLTTAIELARRGLYVFPIDSPELAQCAGIGRYHYPATCTDRGKHPCVPFTKQATTDVHTLAAWFTGFPRNIGIACGLSGLLVVDEDTPGDLAKYAADVGATVPDTFTVSTGRGSHYYFQAGGHDFGNAEERLKSYGVNIRGKGGYVVGPGSLHATGVLYGITRDVKPAPLPEWLVDALSPPPAAAGAVNGSQWEDKPRGLAAVPDVIRGPRPGRPGERHDVLVRYASSLRARDVPNEEALHLFRAVWERCEQPPIVESPMTWDEARSVLADCYGRYTPNYARPDLPELVAMPANTEEPEAEAAPVYAFVAGGSFILDASPDPEPLWGSGDEVILADGEALIVAASQGLGKTTLAQQLALGRCGFPEYADLLDYPIRPGNQRVLYLAMDRPQQARRSFRRMVGEAWRDELDDRLVVWRGPPPADLAKFSGQLTDLCRKAGADTVIVDSLKDACIGLTDDEVGGGYNRARQTALEAGVQVVELHHNRKTIGGVKAARPTLDDLYGSTWISSGAGSVVLLTGAAGDPIVGLHHLKQPAGEVGPMRIIHDESTGRSTVWHAADLLRAAQASAGGLTAVDAARLLFECDKPSPAEKEKARRKLDRLERGGSLTVVEEGDAKANRAKRWGAR